MTVSFDTATKSFHRYSVVDFLHAVAIEKLAN